MDKYALVFIHIPKTGGASLQSIIRKQIPKSKLLEIGVLRGKLKYDDFDKLCVQKKGKIKRAGLTGHFQYGVGAYLADQPKYITMLRNPVDRYLSQYYDVVKKGKRTINHLLQRTDLDVTELDNMYDKSIEYFITSVSGKAFANLQTRYLSGVRINAELDSSALEKAKANLVDEFTYFGITERFDESLEYFKKELNWENIEYKKLNPTPDAKKIKLSENLIEIISQLNSYDMELYHFAVEVFKRRSKAYSQHEFQYKLK